MEPPEVLAIHAVPLPDPKVRQVGFALDDPYVEQVWAGVIGQSALLVLRRLPVLWRDREPAVVDLRELGQSLGLSPSLARSGRPCRTIERLVRFGMAHWLPGRRARCAPEVAPLSGRQLAPGARVRRRVHDRCLARTSIGSPSPTPTGPSTPLASPPASTTPSSAAPPSPEASASNHDLPPLLRHRAALVPCRPSTVVPNPQTQRAHPCRCPCGAPAVVPRASPG
jgi:hypothetical protein